MQENLLKLQNLISIITDEYTIKVQKAKEREGGISREFLAEVSAAVCKLCSVSIKIDNALTRRQNEQKTIKAAAQAEQKHQAESEEGEDEDAEAARASLIEIAREMNNYDYKNARKRFKNKVTPP